MSKKSINQKALSDIYKNIEIALNSLKSLIPCVMDTALKRELKEQRSGYQNLLSETAVITGKSGYNLDKSNEFKLCLLRLSVKSKLIINKSRNHIASMVIQGTVMGINELYAMKNEQTNLEENVSEILTKLLNLEEEYEKRLKTFL